MFTDVFAVLLGLYVDYSSSAVGHICQCSSHVCSEACASNVKCVFGYIADCIEFILGIYTDKSCHISAHVLICISGIYMAFEWHISFDTYMTTAWQIRVAFYYCLTYICSNVGSVCRHQYHFSGTYICNVTCIFLGAYKNDMKLGKPVLLVTLLIALSSYEMYTLT